MLSVRPKVAELAFQLYGRALHPELFEIYKTRTIERNGYQANLHITSAGHVVAWRYGGLTLTEVAASAQHPLPQRRRLLSYRLQGRRGDGLECRGGVTYRMNFQMEPVKPEVFWTFQEELTRTSEHEGLFYAFEASGRMTLGALSYIYLEARDRSLRVRVFHTFPDDYAIVRSESQFILP